MHNSGRNLRSQNLALIPPVTTPTLIGSGPLVLQISKNKQTEFPLKLDYTRLKALQIKPVETKHSIYRYNTTQRPHTRVHSSTGHTPGVHNQPW